MSFPKGAIREKQRIIDEYLKATGHDMFRPAEFLEWLRENEEHPCYGVFFSQADDEAAMEYRKDLVRKWVSGMRLKVRFEEPLVGRSRKVRITEYEVPAMVSPLALRREGGGYYNVNMDDPAHVAELATQAAASLESWLERFGGVAGITGCDLAAINETVGQLRAAAHVSTAA